MNNKSYLCKLIETNLKTTCLLFLQECIFFYTGSEEINPFVLVIGKKEFPMKALRSFEEIIVEEQNSIETTREGGSVYISENVDNILLQLLDEEPHSLEISKEKLKHVILESFRVPSLIISNCLIPLKDKTKNNGCVIYIKNCNAPSYSSIVACDDGEIIDLESTLNRYISALEQQKHSGLHPVLRELRNKREVKREIQGFEKFVIGIKKYNRTHYLIRVLPKRYEPNRENGGLVKKEVVEVGVKLPITQGEFRYNSFEPVLFVFDSRYRHPSLPSDGEYPQKSCIKFEHYRKPRRPKDIKSILNQLISIFSRGDRVSPYGYE